MKSYEQLASSLARDIGAVLRSMVASQRRGLQIEARDIRFV